MYLRRLAVRVFYVVRSMSSTSNTKPPAVRVAPDFDFLTNHGKTLLLIAHDQRIRMRDIADLLHITERATQRIIGELAQAGYVDRTREGRRNVYSVRTEVPLGLPTQRDVDIGSLLSVLLTPDGPGDETRA
jgi:MarR family